MTSSRVRIQQVETLSDNWATLKKTTFDFQRSDGSWQQLTRETYDRGNGATILLYNRQQQTVILTRQFRYPTYVNGHDGFLIETCAGLLDERDPETAIRLETQEETGYTIHEPTRVFVLFMSPGSVTEKIYFFVAEYDAAAKTSAGGGLIGDGEDIGALELPFTRALAMIESGEIMDGKTILLLQYAQLHGLLDA